jgi:serine/threonine protein kinase
MSAEPRQIITSDVWQQWEGKVVNSVFPLRRFLGGSGQNGVFLTEQSTENRPDVAIKFVPADTVQAEAQLVQWVASTTLLHPSLVRIFDVGRYRFEGREYLFVVTEYADQTLAEILPRRPLAVEEVRELLVPTLDALLFLHRKGLIHGHLKPSNFLAVNDRLKLASDTVRPINHTASGRARTSAYDPPELKDRGMNAAGDIWGLGMTLLEALTQRTTAWPDETVSIPADLPAPFANAVSKCLSIAPAARPTVLDLDAQCKAVPVQSMPAAPPSAHQAPQPKEESSQPPRKPGSWRRALAILLPCAIAAWLIVHFFGNRPTPSQPPAAVPTPAPVGP